MDKSRYLRLSLFIPLLVLALSDSLGWVILTFTGAPYLAFAIFMYVITRNTSEGRIKKLSLLAPVLFYPVVSIYWLYYFEAPLDKPMELLESGAVLFIYVAVIGYIFVGLVHVGAWLIYGRKTSNN
jgi:hypothetical protein